MIINIIRTFSREIRAITDINLFHNIYKHFFDKTTENEHIVNKIINCENNQETLINLIHLMNKNVDRCIIVFGCESPEAYGKTVVWQKVSNWCIINKFLFLFRKRLYHKCIFHNLWAMSACVLGCGQISHLMNIHYFVDVVNNVIMTLKKLLDVIPGSRGPSSISPFRKHS